MIILFFQNFFNNQIFNMFIIYSIALVLTLLFEYIESFSDVKKFLYRETFGTMTYWQILHFITRIILGFFSPDYFILITIIDILWETFEKYFLGIEDWKDLVYNIFGVIIGTTIANI